MHALNTEANTRKKRMTKLVTHSELINHLITFCCGIICGVAGAYIAMMISKMWRDTHCQVNPSSYKIRAVLVNIDVLAHIRQCLHRWASRYADAGHARRHVSESKTLVQQMDEILLNQ